LGSISAPFGEPASRFTSQLNVGNMEEGKIATAWAQFGATERSPSMYIRMRVCYLGVTLWAALGSISAPFGEPASRFTSAIERWNMEEVR
jgi:hypothetical protein